jgi:3-hydroxyacyl-CoA dehydrogenase
MKKLCVIGAGTMGAGIAAQAANAGVPVLLWTLCVTRRTAMRWRLARWNG